MNDNDNDYGNDELMALAAELPKEIELDRDLLPEISSRAWRQPELRIVAGEQGGAAGEADGADRPSGAGDAGDTDRTGLVRALYPYRAQLAAAAVVLVALTAGLTAVLVRGSASSDSATGPEAVAVQAEDPAIGSAPAPASDGAPASAALIRYEAVEASYAVVIEQLTQALDSHRADLAPDVVELIEANLAVIDQALNESIAALEGSPADPALRRAVAAAYEQKVGLLRQASALTTGL